MHVDHLPCLQGSASKDVWFDYSVNVIRLFLSSIISHLVFEDTIYILFAQDQGSLLVFDFSLRHIPPETTRMVGFKFYVKPLLRVETGTTPIYGTNI